MWGRQWEWYSRYFESVEAGERERRREKGFCSFSILDTNKLCYTLQFDMTLSNAGYIRQEIAYQILAGFWLSISVTIYFVLSVEFNSTVLSRHIWHIFRKIFLIANNFLFLNILWKLFMKVVFSFERFVFFIKLFLN